MPFTLTIETGGAAFADADGNPDDNAAGVEIRTILGKLQSNLSMFTLLAHDEGKVRDSNGNTVGTWSYVAGPTPVRFQIVPDEDYDPRTSVDWDDESTDAYVARFERGDLAPFGIIVERGEQTASLWGVDVAVSTHADGEHTYQRDAALDVVEIGEWYDEDSPELAELLALPADRSYLAEVLRDLIGEVTG
jgi:hypothetical protein